MTQPTTRDIQRKLDQLQTQYDQIKILQSDIMQDMMRLEPDPTDMSGRYATGFDAFDHAAMILKINRLQD